MMFYARMGRFLCSRLVAKEIGINLYADPGKRWFAAIEDGQILGFASIKGTVVSDCYVIQERRKYGLFTAILNELLNKTSGSLKANCTAASKKAFQNAGFKNTRSTKNFYRMELERA